MSGSPRLVRPCRRLWVVWLALGAWLVAGGADLAHQVLVAHGTCVEHGRLVHGESPGSTGHHAATTTGRPALRSTAADEADGHVHDACPLTSAETGLHLRAAGQLGLPKVTGLTGQSAGQPGLGSLAALDVAPKQGPPA